MPAKDTNMYILLTISFIIYAVNDKSYLLLLLFFIVNNTVSWDL